MSAKSSLIFNLFTLNINSMVLAFDCTVKGELLYRLLVLSQKQARGILTSRYGTSNNCNDACRPFMMSVSVADGSVSRVVCTHFGRIEWISISVVHNGLFSPKETLWMLMRIYTKPGNMEKVSIIVYFIFCLSLNLSWHFDRTHRSELAMDYEFKHIPFHRRPPQIYRDMWDFSLRLCRAKTHSVATGNYRVFCEKLGSTTPAPALHLFAQAISRPRGQCPQIRISD